MGSPVRRQAPGRRLSGPAAELAEALQALPTGRVDAPADRIDAPVERGESGGPPTVSEALLAEIRRRRLTAYAAARLSGVDTAGIARFMSGERTLSQASIDRLAAGLGLGLQPDRRFPEEQR